MNNFPDDRGPRIQLPHMHVTNPRYVNKGENKFSYNRDLHQNKVYKYYNTSEHIRKARTILMILGTCDDLTIGLCGNSVFGSRSLFKMVYEGGFCVVMWVILRSVHMMRCFTRSVDLPILSFHTGSAGP